ncbi:MAG TPA: hypothetical protein DCZ34_03605, partial [Clostridiales bacterium]|nr:hypothetical protein [Clostridiales bacterium]
LVKKHKQAKNKEQALNTKSKSKEDEKVKTETKQEVKVQKQQVVKDDKKTEVVSKTKKPEEDVSAEDLKADSKYNFVYEIKFETGNESENVDMGWKTNNKASAIQSLESRKGYYVNAYINPRIQSISFQAKYLNGNGEIETIDKKYDLYDEDKSASTKSFQKDVEKVLTYMRGAKEEKMAQEAQVENKYNVSFLTDDGEEVEMK